MLGTDKLSSYTGRVHVLRGRAKDAFQSLKEVAPPPEWAQQKWTNWKNKAIETLNGQGDYAHVYRRKTRWELVRVSAAVMGIEFAYAAETAFVSPTLLGIGLHHRHMTLIWSLSPLVGFFLTPLLGSLSDRCKSALGRRRPFIILLSIGIVLGLLLVPNGKLLGVAAGDHYPDSLPLNISSTNTSTFLKEAKDEITDTSTHPWSIFFTVVGTVLLDFDADACQSPSRAYLLDVCMPEDHALGLSTFTIMAGLGGSLGYAMGGINWDTTFIGVMFGGHVRAVFTIVTFIFIFCVACTLCSFREIPLDILQQTGESEVEERKVDPDGKKYDKLASEEDELDGLKTYGTIQNDATQLAYALRDQSHGIANPAFQDYTGGYQQQERSTELQQQEQLQLENNDEGKSNQFLADELTMEDYGDVSLRDYLTSILYMPRSLKILCLTNLFCWMSLVCYSLYFTDFVGEAVFGGDPTAPLGSPQKELYEAGVRFGCWGMAMYSLSCSLYSFVIERLVKRFRARPVYMGGQLVYCVGMILMALTRHKAGVIVFSCTAGVMYSTLFTMPYLLVAHYHASQVFSVSAEGERGGCSQVRGLGTDVAVVSSMVFLAQFILSTCMGSIVSGVGTTLAVVVAASVLSFCGAIAASQVLYLDL